MRFPWFEKIASYKYSGVPSYVLPTYQENILMCGPAFCIIYISIFQSTFMSILSHLISQNSRGKKKAWRNIIVTLLIKKDKQSEYHCQW